MNWTGGQLHRYSTRSGVLSKSQRQSFAKSRQLASNKPSPPRPFVGLGLEELDARDAEIRDRPRGHAEQHLAGSAPAESDNHLDSLKRELLQKHDWAVLSAARPLEVSFASVEETRRFGKRRKLTDTDRKRLTAALGDRPLPLLFQSHQRDGGFSGEIDPREIQIHINGHLANLGCEESQRPTTNHDRPSSQSTMLLDNEFNTLLPSRRPNKLPPSNDSQGTSNICAEWNSRLCSPHERPLLTEPRQLESGPGDSMSPIDQSFRFHLPSQTTSSRHAPELTKQPAPGGQIVAEEPSSDGPRPLTFIDQLLAEHRRPSSPPSPNEMSFQQASISSPELINSLSSGKASSWLPQPQRPTQPSSPLAYRFSAKSRGNVVKEESPLSESDFESQDHATSSLPFKVFGQYIGARDLAQDK